MKYCRFLLTAMLLCGLSVAQNNTLSFLGQEPFRSFVSRAASINQLVYKVVAIGNGDVSYSIVAPTLFVINSTSGVVTNTAPYPASPSKYIIEVQASDGAETVLANLTINVRPSYEKAPRFEHSASVIYVTENGPEDMPVLLVQAFSLAATTTMTYTIVNGNVNGAFYLADGAILYTSTILDRETENQYVLTIRYIDDTGSADALVQINVNDLNDNPPVFSQTLYQFNVDEIPFSNAEVGTVTATDSDHGSNADVEYLLLGTDGDKFSISSEGVVTSNNELDYEAMFQYTMVVQATDGGTDPLTASSTIIVTINNSNDECPVFSASFYVLDIPLDPLNPPQLGTILTITASDPDNAGPVVYAILSGNEGGVFSINADTGNLSLVRSNDIRGEYELTVSASDDHCANTSLTQVEISIGSANEYSPMFTESSCVAQLSENPSVGATVTVLSATDEDLGSNGQVTYDIVPNIGDYELFSVDPATGNVTTTSVPTDYDREKQSYFQIGVTATDGGFRQDFCILVISLEDVNDNSPMFALPTYTIDLGSSLTEGDHILQVQAQDLDFGSNGEVGYSLVSPKGCPFVIDQITGTISVNETTAINEEKCNLQVIATDEGKPMLSGTAQVNISINNEELPVFNQSIYKVTIREDKATSVTILTVNATSSSTVFYTIPQGSDYRTNSEGNFKIFPQSGDIYIDSSKPVDYEQLYPGPYSFRLLVTATSNSRVAVATVIVNVTDVNDNFPIFPHTDPESQTPPTVVFSIVEHQPPGPIGIVQAYDADTGENGIIVYEIVGSNDQFTVSTNGTVSSLAEEFDAEAEIANFEFYISAYNPGLQDKNGLVIVRVVIEDINDNPPTFAVPHYTLSLNETHLVHSKLITLTADEPDRNDQNNLVFTVLNGNSDGTFELVSKTGGGLLYLRRQLDYERTTQYVLGIEVSDGLYTDTTTVTINVLNVDDEAPVFEHTEYTANVVENAAINTELLSVQATDVDSDVIQYELTGLAEGRFSVDSNGIIKVAGTIDREEFLPSAQIVFLVFAYGGSLTTANIFINISDINDNAPQFINSPFHGSVPENTDPGANGLYVVTVTAIDLDEGGNGTISYTLVSGEEEGFSIDINTGAIVANKRFDREEMRFYMLQVRATDQGHPVPLSSEVDVIVEVSDYNDNPPYWPYPYMFARVFENAPLGKVVIELPVADPDNGINGSVTFNLTGGNKQEKFSLNTITGEVLVAGALNYEIEEDRQHFMYFSIRDNGNPSYSANEIGELEIHVLDGNDHAPFFTDSSETVEVREDVSIGYLVINVAATDGDTGTNSQLTYSIDREDLFTITQDNTSATVYTNAELDYEEEEVIVLALTVVDNGYPSLSSVFTLHVMLINVNDKAPMFTQTIYRQSVVEHTSPPLTVLTTEATDPDGTIAGGTVAEYRIFSSNDEDHKFDYIDGTLSMNQELDREDQSQYTFVVIAVDDDPVDPLTGTATIIVDVSDINDNPSQNGGNMDITVRTVGGTFPARELGFIYFDDPDEQDQFINCTLLNGDSDLFGVNYGNCTVSSLINAITPATYQLTVMGNDGKNEYVSTTVTITYEETPVPPLSSLVTMTIHSSESDYLENIHSNIVNEMSSILSLSPSQLIIFSVQRGYHDPEATVDITLAVASDDGYLDQQLLIHKLYIKRMQIDDEVVYSLPVDACVSEPCFNLGECHSTATLHPSSYGSVVSRQHVLYTPLIEMGYECECARGTAGDLCALNYDDCYSSPCHYGATCFDGVNGFTCDCPSGTFGNDCSVNPNECSADTCSNDATCINGFGAYYCDCASLFYGTRCEYAFFETSDLCDLNPCNNGGTCSPGRDNFTCLCQTGFTGPTCDDAVEYQGGCVGNPCYNGSICTETEEGFVCTCSVGFTGPQCRFPLNNCELELCRNGATCETGHYGSYHCVCPSGYTGEHCTEVLSPCESNPCDNGGTCTATTDDGYTCECSKRFYGDNCEYAVQPPDYCTNSVCEFGNCTSGQTLYTCSCFTNYGGVHCDSVIADSSLCDSNPCRYGGTCTDNNNGTYTCTCPTGFTGQDCLEEIDECEGDPCTNGGQCINGFGSFLCSCLQGYGGRRCEVACPQGFVGERCEVDLNYCSSDTCSNGGSCVEERDGYTCICPPNYTGPHCTMANDCNINNCLHDGECTDSDTTGFVCRCLERYGGPHCELNTVSFLGNTVTASYRAYDALPFRSRGEISFRFATQSTDGMLLLKTQHQKGESIDHIAVEIVDGNVVIRYSHGDVPNNITLLSSTVDINDGQWHQLHIQVSGKELSALLDYCTELQSSPLLLTHLDCMASSISPGLLSAIDTGLPLWLGGVPASPDYLPVSSWGITACISDVYIDNTLIDLDNFIDEYRAQAGCPQIEDSCNNVDCGQGTCVPMWNSYRCDCDAAIAGEHCDKDADIITYDGLTYAQYTIHDEEESIVKRQANIASSSSYSEQLSLWLRTTSDNGVVYLLGDVIGEHHLVKINSGRLLYSINVGSTTETFALQSLLSNEEWHYVSVSRTGLLVDVTINNDTIQYTLSGQQITLEYDNNDIYVSGRPGGNGQVREGYRGCIRDVRLHRLPLPTTGSNNVASVVYVGEGPEQGCSLGPCFPNPCGGGNCSETIGNGYQCLCPNGEIQSSPCENTGGLSLTEIIVMAACLGVLVAILIIAFVIGCIVMTKKGKKHKISLDSDIVGQFEIHENASTGIYHTQDCEEDTHLDEPDSVVRNGTLPSQLQYSESSHKSSRKGSAGKTPSPPLPRATTPDIDAFIEEKVNKANRELTDYDSLHNFADEGIASSMSSLSTICSSIDDGEPCTMERLRLVGPEFQKIADLLEPVYAYDSDDTSSENSPQF